MGPVDFVKMFDKTIKVIKGGVPYPKHAIYVNLSEEIEDYVNIKTNKKMASKFLKNLTQNGPGIKETRARLTADDTKAAQEELLRKLQQEKRNLERELDTLSDVYPDTELSLQPTKEGYKATNWVNKVQNIKVALKNKQVEINTAQETYDEYFTEEADLSK